MTLHEAIELILQGTDKAMTTREIADIINKKGLYMRRDNLPVSAAQVSARTNNYKEIFVSELGKIKLVKNDLVSKYYNKYYNNKYISSFKQFKYNKNTKIDSLQNAINELLNDNYFVLDGDKSQKSLPVFDYRNSTELENKLLATYQLCNLYLLQDRKQQGVLSDVLTSFLSGLEWFNKSDNTIITDIFGYNFFLLKIVAQNSKSTFNFKLKDSNENLGLPSETLFLNSSILKLLNSSYQNTIKSQKQISTGIFLPPFGKRQRDGIPLEFQSTISEIDNNLLDLDKIILLVPSGVTMSSQLSYINARKRIVKSNYLEAVIDLPFGLIENTAISLTLMIFDFSRNKNDQIFFLDANRLIKEDFSKTVEILKTKESVYDISKSVFPEILENENFNLSPKIYITDISDFKIEEGNKVFELSDLLKDYKAGKGTDTKNLYTGGECKMIRISDIIAKSIYFTPSEKILGIDQDQLEEKDYFIVNSGLVSSSMNNYIKVNTLTNKENYLLGRDVFWLKPKSDLVLDEFLTMELLKPYVTKQVEYYSKGATYSRLFLKDLLKIKVQIPPLKRQKEILFEKLRLNEKQFDDKNTISENELDFIKTLKHTLKQPAAGLANDFSSLRTFLKNKIRNKEFILPLETIVPVFKEDTPETIEMYSLNNTLKRMDRAIKDIDYILEQAIQIISIATPEKKEIEIKSFLNKIKSEYQNQNIKIIGSKINLLADPNQIRILMHNFINNAIDHGFKDENIDPTIWIEIINKDSLSMQLSIRNNGIKLPPEFTIEDFLAKGGSKKADVGSGFGGFLIGQIIKNHNGEIVLTKQKGFGILPHNVEFLITFPK